MSNTKQQNAPQKCKENQAISIFQRQIVNDLENKVQEIEQIASNNLRKFQAHHQKQLENLTHAINSEKVKWIAKIQQIFAQITTNLKEQRERHFKSKKLQINHIQKLWNNKTYKLISVLTSNNQQIQTHIKVYQTLQKSYLSNMRKRDDRDSQNYKKQILTNYINGSNKEEFQQASRQIKQVIQNQMNKSKIRKQSNLFNEGPLTKILLLLQDFYCNKNQQQNTDDQVVIRKHTVSKSYHRNSSLNHKSPAYLGIIDNMPEFQSQLISDASLLEQSKNQFIRNSPGLQTSASRLNNPFIRDPFGAIEEFKSQVMKKTRKSTTKSSKNLIRIRQNSGQKPYNGISNIYELAKKKKDLLKDL